MMQVDHMLMERGVYGIAGFLGDELNTKGFMVRIPE